MRVLTGKEDGGEQILASIERATGSRPIGCPWRAFEDPFVAEVLKAYRWFKANQLSVVWPNPPAALIRGLEVYDAAVNAVQATDIRDERERREKERREQKLNARVADKRGRR